MSQKIRVAIIDDHTMFRDGIAEMVGTFEDVEVVAQGASSAEAIEIARTLSPDVILMDLDMPAADGAPFGGVAATEQIRELDPAIAIVVVTMHEDPALVRRLLHVGARGFMSKTAGRTELHAAITAARGVGGSVTVTLSGPAAGALSNPAAADAAALTTRELHVLTMLAATGLSNQALAVELHLSPSTVKRHLATIYDKLGVNSRIQAVRKARVLGLIADI